MPSSAYALFRQAVLNKQQIVCTYQGYEREICPHCLGHKSGREKALSFQFAGGSSSGLPPGGQWRCMFLDEVTNVRVKDGSWHTSPDHSRPNTCVDEIDVEARV